MSQMLLLSSPPRPQKKKKKREKKQPNSLPFTKCCQQKNLLQKPCSITFTDEQFTYCPDCFLCVPFSSLHQGQVLFNCKIMTWRWLTYKEMSSFFLSLLLLQVQSNSSFVCMFGPHHMVHLTRTPILQCYNQITTSWSNTQKCFLTLS